MTPLALLFLIIAILILWGGLVASVVYLRVKPERETYPPGGDEPGTSEA